MRLSNQSRVLGLLCGIAVATASVGFAQEVASEVAEEEAASDSNRRLKFGMSGYVESSSNPYLREDAVAESGVVITVAPYFSFINPVNELLELSLYGKIAVVWTILDDEGATTDRDETSVQPYLDAHTRYNFDEFSSLSLGGDWHSSDLRGVANEDEYEMFGIRLGGDRDLSDLLSAGIWVGYDSVQLVGTADAGALIESREDSFGGSLNATVLPRPSGRSVVVGLSASAGEKEFDESAGFEAVQDSSDNPKTHEYYNWGLAVTIPLSPLMTLYGNGGYSYREYEVDSSAVTGRDDETESPVYGLTLSMIPSVGSPLSLTLAASFEVTDTIINNIPEENRAVFEAEDASINTLTIEYREMEVTRFGAVVDYDVNSRLNFSVAGSFQNSIGDIEEDLGPISGDKSGDTFVGTSTDLDQWSYSLHLDYAIYETLLLGIGFEQGIQIDNDITEGEDELYQYDSAAFTLTYRL